MYKSLKMQAFVFLTVASLVTACSSPDPVAYRDVASASYLKPNPKNEAGHTPYAYSTQVDWKKYKRAIIDPVTIYKGADGQFDDMSEEDKATLATYMQAQFFEKLSKRFEIGNRAAPGTLRIKLTLTGAATNTSVVSTFTRLDLSGSLYNGVQAVRGHEGVFTGSVLYVVEIYDASTDELLDASVVKQYPGAYNIGATFGSLAAAETGIEKGADALVERLN
jgi:hypothetical protein